MANLSDPPKFRLPVQRRQILPQVVESYSDADFLRPRYPSHCPETNSVFPLDAFPPVSVYPILFRDVSSISVCQFCPSTPYLAQRDELLEQEVGALRLARSRFPRDDDALALLLVQQRVVGGVGHREDVRGVLALHHPAVEAGLLVTGRGNVNVWRTRNGYRDFLLAGDKDCK